MDGNGLAVVLANAVGVLDAVAVSTIVTGASWDRVGVAELNSVKLNSVVTSAGGVFV